MQLGKYLDEMRKRHPRLSMRQMAIEAGIGESLVYGIIKDERGARPETLKALADRWGTPEDYKELMRLAGHPLPAEADLDAEQQAVARRYGLVDEETKRRVRAILRETTHDYKPPGLSEITSPEFIDSFTSARLNWSATWPTWSASAPAWPPSSMTIPRYRSKIYYSSPTRSAPASPAPISSAAGG